MSPEEVQSIIAEKMPDAQVSVSGGEGKFVAEVVSNEFEGLMLLKRHKLVYATVNEQITSGELHALTIVAKTPAEVG